MYMIEAMYNDEQREGLKNAKSLAVKYDMEFKTFAKYAIQISSK